MATKELVGSTSKCTMTDAALLKKCKEDEDKAAAKKKIEDDKNKKPVKEQKTYPKSSSGNLECTKDGFNAMFKALIENIFIALALVKETFAYLIPEDLNLAVQYGWDGLMGLGGWIGYLFAAVYYVGLDFG